MQENASCSFTLNGEDSLFEAADSILPGKMDTPALLRVLQEKMRVIPFGDYLRRYLYLATGMDGPFRDVPNETYRTILINAFRDSVTPGSLRGERMRLSTAAWRWLEFPTVQREGVLLLGFGLSMTVEDVNLLLTKACHGHELDPDDPLEGICRHCYARRYSFSRMQLLRSLLEEDPETWKTRLEKGTPGSGFHAERMIHDDLALLRRLAAAGQPTPMIRKTREVFTVLYDQVCAKIAKEMNKERSAVTCSDVERHFCPITRLDAHGNMVMKLHRDLRPILEGKRMSRHRAYLLLNRQLEPARHDILNLLFFLRAEEDAWAEPRQRLTQFVDRADRLLGECGFSPVYTADPYECLLMLSLLSEDPMGFYLDVLEQALDRGEKA